MPPCQKVSRSRRRHNGNTYNDVTYNDFTYNDNAYNTTGDITYTDITYDINKCIITCMFYLLL